MEKVSFEISREEELPETVRSFPILWGKSYKRFKEKDTVKNAWDAVVTPLKFIPTVIIFILTLLFYFLKLSYSFELTQ